MDDTQDNSRKYSIFHLVKCCALIVPDLLNAGIWIYAAPIEAKKVSSLYKVVTSFGKEGITLENLHRLF
jgi:hypothetical protein